MIQILKHQYFSIRHKSKRKLSVTFAGLDKAKLSFAVQVRNYQTQYYKSPRQKRLSFSKIEHLGWGRLTSITQVILEASLGRSH